MLFRSSGKKYKKCCMNKDAHTVVESSEFILRKLRNTENELVKTLMAFAATRLGEEALGEAWDEFRFWEDEGTDTEELMGIDSIFSIWFVFIWDAWDILDEIDGGSEILELPRVTIAMLYMEENPELLDDFQRRYIRESSLRPYSFYQITGVCEGRSLTLRDILLNQTHVVLEKQGSRPDTKGGILFTRVVTLDGVSVMVGCFPIVIPPHYQSPIIDLRRYIEKEEGGTLTAGSLLENDFELREIFSGIYDNSRERILPELQNTDGEALVPVRLLYDLLCTPEEALSRLKSLADGIDDEELKADAVYYKAGALRSIRFPWLKKGNEQHPEWENTIMGEIDINKKRLSIEVNSVSRSDIIQKEIKKRLGEKAVYKKSVMTSIEKMLEKGNKAGSDVKAQELKATHDELMQLPEVKDKIAEMAKKHWETWPDIPVPALGNMTPRQAAKDPVGREKLEGLFLHYESMIREQDQGEFKPDIPALKRMLGMDRDSC